jgi:predicted CopG family antitoxin
VRQIGQRCELQERQVAGAGERKSSVEVLLRLVEPKRRELDFADRDEP